MSFFKLASVTTTPEVETSRVEQLLGALAFLALAFVIVSSVTRPLFYYDNWWYHLPFSAHLWDIGGAARTFVLSDEMRARYEGFPLLAEFLQGALWKATGTINATTLINSVALGAFVVAAAANLRLSVPLLVFGSLTVPMIALHATSAYIDLFVASSVCMQALAAAKLAEWKDREAGSLRARVGLWAAAYVAAAAAAGNAKTTGLLLSLAISAFVLAHLLWRRRTFSRKRLRSVVIVLAAASLLSAGTLLKNTARFSNPLYPFDLYVAGVHLEGPEPQYHNYPDYTEWLGIASRPANWLLSITEIDWTLRGVKREYSLDSSNGDRPARHGPARTGGYWGLLVIVTLALAIALAVLAARRGALGRNGFLLALFAYLSLVTAFLPQSHELRYYLYWPLMLMLVTAVLVYAAGLSARARVALAIAYLCALVVSQAWLLYPLKVWPLITESDSIAAQSSPAEIEQARKTGGACLGPAYNPRQFAYASIFHGGDYVIEQGWTRCAHYPDVSRR